ncbi:Hypothetical predicted protein [Lecanosticta acicola]|uniref:WW domain-containing protein n=1 Tax=Lecanosticta acicola TaxID=111012 RepID=A0AAI9EC62_9PEZI|nr:Hypothetical predicted protein [Lecanosticta acicola]
MSGAQVPEEPPPSYSQATGSSAAPGPPSSSAGPSSGNVASSHLNVPGASPSQGKNGGIPAEYRRSMEDEMRPLPEGWVRTFDPNNHHQFFVDTTKDPPRSIWHHPYDDDEYLATLSGEERERIEQDSMNRGKHHPSHDDIVGAHSEDEDDHQHATAAAASASSSSGTKPDLPPRPDGKGKQPDNRSFGRKFKDKVTGMTHEQRVEERKRRAEEEQRAYEQHMRMRQAMARAMETGQPQHLGKDRDGKDIYIEPPPPPPQAGYGPYGRNGYGYNPYGGNSYQPGIYTTPNARYIRPAAPYGRPYGSGFGGGYGLPLAIGGGLLGGMLLGDALLF